MKEMNSIHKVFLLFIPILIMCFLQSEAFCETQIVQLNAQIIGLPIESDVYLSSEKKSEDVAIITDLNFDEEVLKSNIPVLVNFWAAWCGPCRQLSPVIDELAKEYKGKVKVGKLDTEENNYTPAKFGITAIPTIILFKNGLIVKKVVGVKSKKELKYSLDALLK